MQGGFEKHIQQQMQDFNLEPSPMVWKEIDDALNNKKRRRFVAWWWLLPTAAAILGVILILTSKTTKNSTDSLKENAAQKKSIITDSNSYHIKEQRAVSDEKDNAIVITDKQLSESKRNESKNQTKDKNPDSDITALNSTNTITGYGTSKKNQTDLGVIADTGKKIATIGYREALRLNGEMHQQAIKQPKDSSYLKTSKKLLNNEATASSTIKIKTTSTKKTRWSIIAGGGLTATKESSFGHLGSATTAYFDSSPGNLNSGSSGNNGRPDSALYISEPDGGYHILAGVQFAHEISRIVAITAGVQYRFLSNRQKTGSAVYSGQYNPFAGAYLVNNAGTSNQVTNKAHWLEVPVNLQFTLNPKSKTNIFVEGGGSYAWMFASKWILPDTKLNKLYYNESLLNKNIINLNIGAGVRLSSALSFGLRYQRSITTLANSQNVPNLIWQNVSLYSTIPLQFKKQH